MLYETEVIKKFLKTKIKQLEENDFSAMLVTLLDLKLSLVDMSKRDLVFCSMKSTYQAILEYIEQLEEEEIERQFKDYLENERG